MRLTKRLGVWVNWQTWAEKCHSALKRSPLNSTFTCSCYRALVNSDYASRVIWILHMQDDGNFLFALNSFDSAPLSASLLSDWSEVHRMTPADLESLQQELQLGSPMILTDSIPPDA